MPLVVHAQVTRLTQEPGKVGGIALEATMLLHPRRMITLVQSLSLLLAPHGGQHVARRNAWAGMSRDAALARDRRAAELALAVAAAQAGVRGSAAR